MTNTARYIPEYRKLAILKSKVEQLRKTETVDILDIVDWIGNNLNAVNSYALGNPGRELGKNIFTDYKVWPKLSAPVVVVAATWRFEDFPGEEPELSPLSHVLEGAVTSKGEHKTHVLIATITLQLNQWPHLVPQLVRSMLNELVNPGDMLDFEQDAIRDQLKDTLERFYPDVVPDVVLSAVSLGLLDVSSQTFAHDLKALLTKKQSSEAPLPCDMLGPT